MPEIKFTDLVRIVVGVDPPGSDRTECGIVVVGRSAKNHLYVLDDKSMAGTPNAWSTTAIDAYLDWEADRIVAETNYGGTMVEEIIRKTANVMRKEISYKNVVATRGKAVRAEPIVARYERGEVHHVGNFPQLESEMVSWVPGDKKSPNRMDALVWACTELRTGGAGMIRGERKESMWRDR